jgi:streptogramin lyase
MGLDWKSLLYAPIHQILGESATLYPVGSGSPVAMTVLDKTGGIEVSDGSGVDIGTVRPAAVLRKHELTNAGLTNADLEGATLALNGKFWLVKSWFPRPAPNGETDGEVWLIMIEGDEPDGSA